MAQAPLILALDVGTSSVRAALYDRHGRMRPGREISLPYKPEITADGGASVSAGRLARLVFAAVDRVLAPGVAIAGVGVSTFWHSLVGLGASGAPSTPVLLWADLRSTTALPSLRARLAAESRAGADAVAAYHQRTGAPLHPSFWPAKLYWLAATASPARSTAWFSFADYLYLRLFGETRTSVSMASATGLWNRKQQTWDAETLAVLGLAAGRLPEVSDTAFTRLLPRWARRWPALATVPWFPAWGDGACANAGSGAVSAGRLALTVGTSSALRAVVPARREFPLPPSLWRYALDARRHLVGGALSEGGNVYAWLRATLRFAALSDAQLERRLARLPPDEHGLTLLPFFAGERSPGWQPERRAVIAGLSLATTPEELARAGLEAVALQLAGVHEDLAAALGRAKFEILAGGAALRHSDLWTQMMADALACPVTRLADAETSARGAALLAAERLGLGALEQAPVTRDRNFLPRPGAAARFRAARRRQRALYERQIAPLPRVDKPVGAGEQ